MIPIKCEKIYHKRCRSCSTSFKTKLTFGNGNSNTESRASIDNVIVVYPIIMKIYVLSSIIVIKSLVNFIKRKLIEKEARREENNALDLVHTDHLGKSKHFQAVFDY